MVCLGGHYKSKLLAQTWVNMYENIGAEPTTYYYDRVVIGAVIQKIKQTVIDCLSNDESQHNWCGLVVLLRCHYHVAGSDFHKTTKKLSFEQNGYFQIYFLYLKFNEAMQLQSKSHNRPC